MVYYNSEIIDYSGKPPAFKRLNQIKDVEIEKNFFFENDTFELVRNMLSTPDNDRSVTRRELHVKVFPIKTQGKT